MLNLLVQEQDIHFLENKFIDNLLSIKKFSDLERIVESNPKLLLQKMYDNIENFSGETEKYKNSYYQLSTDKGEIYILKNEENIVFIGNNLFDIYKIDKLVHNVLYVSGGSQYCPSYDKRDDEKNLVPICEINGNKFLFSIETGKIETDDNGNLISYVGIQDNDTYTGSTTGWNNSIGYNFDNSDSRFIGFNKKTLKDIGRGYIRYGKYIYIKDEGKNVLRIDNIYTDKNKIGANGRSISYDPDTGELIKNENGNYINDCGEYFMEYVKDYEREYKIVGIGLVIDGEYKNIRNSGNIFFLKEYLGNTVCLEFQNKIIKVGNDSFSFDPQTLEIETDEYCGFII